MRHLVLFAALGLLSACREPAPPAPAQIGLHPDPLTVSLSPEALPGGRATVIELNPETDKNLQVLSRPSATLEPSGRSLFSIGNAFFTRPWVVAPASTTARDGLGPLFNAAACQDCHVRDGRGHPPTGPDEDLVAALLRIARLDGTPHPRYGQQVQTRAIPGLAPEARVRVHWETFTETLPDDTVIELRRPRVQVSDWAYGEPGPLSMSLRVAPAMSGMGLLEAIPEADLVAYAAEQALRDDGIAGTPRWVKDLETGATTLGRFGWRAEQPSVRQQTLMAFAHDMGITSVLIPQDACTPAQQACKTAPSGGEPELHPEIETAVVHYARHLALPARRDAEREDVRAGEALFHAIGCATCHRPSWRTGAAPLAPELAHQLIWPYTDLLLHDLGDGLADGLNEPGLPSPRHWRTAPLWGLRYVQWLGGAKAGFLHDGRARSLTEAILWHGGSAQASRDAWAALSREERRQVLRFLASL